MPSLAVCAEFKERGTDGSGSRALSTHCNINGRLGVAPCPEPKDPHSRRLHARGVCKAIVIASLAAPDTGLSTSRIQSVQLALAAEDQHQWLSGATDPEAEKLLDCEWFMQTTDSVRIFTGTAVRFVDGQRLQLSTPSVFVSIGPVDDPDFTLSAHACMRRRFSPDEGVAFTTHCFITAPGRKALELRMPLHCYEDPANAHLVFPTHHAKRCHVRKQHNFALRSLCLFDPEAQTKLSVLPDATIVCKTAFANSESVFVSLHMPC